MSCLTVSSAAKPIWRGRDNAILLRLDRTNSSGDTVAVDLSMVAKMTLKLNTGDSVTCEFNAPEAEIDWWDDGLQQGEVNLVLGKWVEAAGIANGNYTGMLIVFGPETPDGIVWSDEGRNNLFFKVVNG